MIWYRILLSFCRLFCGVALCLTGCHFPSKGQHVQGCARTDGGNARGDGRGAVDGQRAGLQPAAEPHSRVGRRQRDRQARSDHTTISANSILRSSREKPTHLADRRSARVRGAKGRRESLPRRRFLIPTLRLPRPCRAIWSQCRHTPLPPPLAFPNCPTRGGALRRPLRRATGCAGRWARLCVGVTSPYVFGGKQLLWWSIVVLSSWLSHAAATDLRGSGAGDATSTIIVKPFKVTEPQGIARFYVDTGKINWDYEGFVWFRCVPACLEHRLLYLPKSAVPGVRRVGAACRSAWCVRGEGAEQRARWKKGGPSVAHPTRRVSGFRDTWTTARSRTCRGR